MQSLFRTIFAGQTLRCTLARRQINIASWQGKRRRRARGGGRGNNDRIEIGTKNVANESNTLPSQNINITNIKRFLNPWDELSRIIVSEEVLHDRVEATTRTFGIVAALIDSLEAALLTFKLYDGYDANREPAMHYFKGKNAATNKDTQNPFFAIAVETT